MKSCNGPCKSLLPFDAFHKGNGSFNLKSRCKNCCKVSYKNNSVEYKKQYYLFNLEKAREARRAHQDRNREDYRRRSREYDKTHQAEKAAREAFRRAQKMNATPPWLTIEHKKQIENLYKLRDRLTLETNIAHHVDHIVPLIHKQMCGLHVPWNLQVITATQNLSKSNKVE
jgi:hypothetical protein